MRLILFAITVTFVSGVMFAPEAKASMGGCGDALTIDRKEEKPFVAKVLGENLSVDLVQGEVFRGFANVGKNAQTAPDLARLLFNRPEAWLKSEVFRRSLAALKMPSVDGAVVAERQVYRVVGDQIRERGVANFIAGATFGTPIIGADGGRGGTTLYAERGLLAARDNAVAQARTMRRHGAFAGDEATPSLLIFRANLKSPKAIRIDRGPGRPADYQVLSHIEGREIESVYMGFSRGNAIHWYEAVVTERFEATGLPSEIKLFRLETQNWSDPRHWPFSGRVVAAIVNRDGVLMGVETPGVNFKSFLDELSNRFFGSAN